MRHIILRPLVFHSNFLMVYFALFFAHFFINYTLVAKWVAQKSRNILYAKKAEFSILLKWHHLPWIFQTNPVFFSKFFYRLILFWWCNSVSNEKIFIVIPYIPPNSVSYLLGCISIPKHMPTRHCQIVTLKSIWNILLIIFHKKYFGSDKTE